MIGMTDYHVHSILSDGKNSYEELIETAISKGLEEIGFSDHVCLKPVTWAIPEIDIPVMAEQIAILKDRYKDRIRIKFGIEMDYLPGMEDEIKALIISLPLDYVIGSVHFIGNWNFDTDKSLYGKWPNDELYRMYFDLIQKAARSGLFDIIGHLDIIKKFRIYPETDQSALINQTLKIIKESNLVVEVNTGGLDRPCAELTPSPAIVEQCYHHRIPLMLNSDAHKTEQIARHFEPTVDLLRKIGVDELIRFEKRKRQVVRL